MILSPVENDAVIGGHKQHVQMCNILTDNK